MTFIFTAVDRAMLGEHVRYLERGCMTSRKFFRGMENQVFLEKRHILKGLTNIFGNFKTPKNECDLLGHSEKCHYSLKYAFKGGGKIKLGPDITVRDMTLILFASYRANAGPPRKCFWIFYMTFRFFCRGLQS